MAFTAHAEVSIMNCARVIILVNRLRLSTLDGMR